jgi:hypothetical protein
LLSDDLSHMMRDEKCFSEDPNTEASIFVRPYYCTNQKTERRTKSTTIILVTQSL